MGEVRGGTVGGLLKFRDDIFEKLRDDLDILVTKMANSINNIHKNGLNNNGDVGNLVFDLSPKYMALNSTDGTNSTGIKVTAPAGTPDINIKAKWDGVKNEWTVIDLVNETRSIIQPNSREDRAFLIMV